jgi:hypothetical protein
MPVEDMRRIAARLAYGLGRRLQWQRRGRGSYPLLHGFLHRCLQRRLGLLGLLGFRRPVVSPAPCDDAQCTVRQRLPRFNVEPPTGPAPRPAILRCEFLSFQGEISSGWPVQNIGEKVAVHVRHRPVSSHIVRKVSCTSGHDDPGCKTPKPERPY